MKYLLPILITVLAGCATTQPKHVAPPVYAGVTQQTTAIRDALKNVTADSKEVKAQQSRALQLVDKLESATSALIGLKP
jgi:uncharacterized protein YceK